MPKSTEKEPLLFVDTTYKGCFVKEQSFFKTPTPKPKDIKADNYVHNFDQMSENSFESFIPSNVTIHEVSEASTTDESVPPLVEEGSDEEEESCPYETVNILVDYQEQPSIPTFEEEAMSLPVKEAAMDEADSLPIEEVVVNETNLSVEDIAMNDLDSFPVEEIAVNEADSLSVQEVAMDESESLPVEANISVYERDEDAQFVQEEEQAVSSENHEEVLPVIELDEKQQEILSFIQDLTNRPSMMKAPIVQIVKKDGQLKSGMIQVVDDWHISIDDLMDNIETISIKDIEGIRILHL